MSVFREKLMFLKLCKLEKLKQKEIAISLISLIVTIIIVLILSGVVISISVGNNGVIKKAKQSVALYENATLQDEEMLNEFGNLMDSFSFDEEYPTDTAPVATATTNKLIISLKQVDIGKSGIDSSKTMYRLVSDESASNALTSWQSSKIFENLDADTTYYFQSRVTDKAGNTTISKVGSESTSQVPVLIKDANIFFEYTPSEETTGSVTVTITTKIMGFTLQTNVEDGEWTNATKSSDGKSQISTQIVTENNKSVNARLFDGRNYGEEASITITNINK